MAQPHLAEQLTGNRDFLRGTLDDVMAGRVTDAPIADATVQASVDGHTFTAQADAGVDAANAKLARVEQIKKFTIVRGDWAPGGDELTPTMKLKRKPIEQRYAGEIDALYAQTV